MVKSGANKQLQLLVSLSVFGAFGVLVGFRQTTFFVQRGASKSGQYQQQHYPDFLLTVPFYVYEDLAWTNATYNNHLFSELDGRKGWGYKHSEDYWFMKAAFRHPMRTLDPSEAKLFVIPTLINLYSRRVARLWDPFANFTLCNHYVCDNDLLEQLYQRLSTSTWFRRYDGRDHIVVASHFGYGDEVWYQHEVKIPKKVRKLLARCNMITFESNRFNDIDRFSYPSYYVGFPCPNSSDKLYDAAMIATLKPDQETFLDRLKVCEWTKDDRLNCTMPICGGGDQCPFLGANGRYL